MRHTLPGRRLQGHPAGGADNVVGSVQHVPVDDDAGTDTGSHGNEYGTVTFFGGTLPHLSIHIAGTVAVDVYLDARRRYTAQLLIEGVVVPAGMLGAIPGWFGSKRYRGCRHLFRRRVYGFCVLR